MHSEITDIKESCLRIKDYLKNRKKKNIDLLHISQKKNLHNFTIQ